jgi:hypothetical protein
MMSWEEPLPAPAPASASAPAPAPAHAPVQGDADAEHAVEAAAAGLLDDLERTLTVPTAHGAGMSVSALNDSRDSEFDALLRAARAMMT